jgi:hypothetical protein
LSEGDTNFDCQRETQLKAIQTIYKGTRFRSKLEASYAKTLDSLHVRWTYETNGYHLGKTKYLPDFWLPDINTFLEVKGPAIPGAEKAEALAKAVHDDQFDPKTIVILANEMGEMKLPDDGDEVYLLKCSMCSKYWFVGISKSYACRHCGAHDGDRHVEEWHNQLTLEQITIQPGRVMS